MEIEEEEILPKENSKDIPNISQPEISSPNEQNNPNKMQKEEKDFENFIIKDNNIIIHKSILNFGIENQNKILIPRQ